MYRAILILLAIVLVAATAQAQEKYQRKSGLWELKRSLTRTDDQQRTFLLCVDQSSDNALHQLAGGVGSEACEASKVVREGKQLIVDATCKGARTSAATTHAVITGTFDSAYKIESKSTYDPPVRGKSEGAALIEAKWTGACKPGQKPGDVMLPSGAKLRSAGTDKNASDKAGAAATQTPRQSEKRKGGGAYVPPPPTTK